MRNFVLYYLCVFHIACPDGYGSPVFVGGIVDAAAADFNAVAEQVAVVGDMCLETAFAERSCHDGRAANILKLAGINGGNGYTLFQIEGGCRQMTESALKE